DLREEAEGILDWMVEGLKQYDKIGLDPSTCAAVERATSTYLEERNPLLPAIEAGFIELQEKAETSGKDLRETLNDFYDEHPTVRRLTTEEFVDALRALGCTRRNTNKGRVWTGVKVRATTP